MNVRYPDLSQELDWYWFQADLFQSQEAAQTRGPFTMMMSRYMDGQGWLRLLLHIHEQSKACKDMGYQREHITESLWLIRNVTAYKWRIIRVLVDIGVKDGDAGEAWLYEAFHVPIFNRKLST